MVVSVNLRRQGGISQSQVLFGDAVRHQSNQRSSGGPKKDGARLDSETISDVEIILIASFPQESIVDHFPKDPMRKPLSTAGSGFGQVKGRALVPVRHEKDSLSVFQKKRPPISENSSKRETINDNAIALLSKYLARF